MSSRTVIDCGELSVPDTAMGELTVDYIDTVWNSTASFDCESDGFELIGNSEIICLSNGEWSGSVPYCQRKKKLFLSPAFSFIQLLTVGSLVHLKSTI